MTVWSISIVDLVRAGICTKIAPVFFRNLLMEQRLGVHRLWVVVSLLNLVMLGGNVEMHKSRMPESSGEVFLSRELSVLIIYLSIIESKFMWVACYRPKLQKLLENNSKNPLVPVQKKSTGICGP